MVRMILLAEFFIDAALTASWGVPCGSPRSPPFVPGVISDN